MNRQQELWRAYANRHRLPLVRGACMPGAALLINARPRPSAQAAFQRYLQAERHIIAGWRIPASLDMHMQLIDRIQRAPKLVSWCLINPRTGEVIPGSERTVGKTL